MIAISFEPTFEDWRAKARELLSADVRPEEVLWSGGAQSALFGDAPLTPTRTVTVPRDFLKIADLVACHRDERRWGLLYRTLFRLTHGEPELLKIEIDSDVRDLSIMHKQVAHDIHRMHAFVRFRQSGDEYIAWHRPDHLIVRKTAPWFAARFGKMRWSILTPDACAHWDQRELRYGPGVPRSAAPEGDELEELWRSYYASVFNPARLNPKLLEQHMPRRYWSTLPEAEVFSKLIHDAGSRERMMTAAQPRSASAFIPPHASLDVLREAVCSCRGCDLYEKAAQPVFGEGSPEARIVFVGEQPGDAEDRAGKPFVGPAGRLFDQAIKEAGLDRSSLYVTNAVKHFRFEERGKVRLHKTASRAQISSCQAWLDAELALIRPRLIVCLGATAVLSVIGKGIRLMEERGQVRPHRFADGALVTIHPSFLLRLPDAERQTDEYQRFVADLRMARTFAEAA